MFSAIHMSASKQAYSTEFLLRHEICHFKTDQPFTYQLSFDNQLIMYSQELQELVSQEQSVIMQTSNALNQCCSSNSYFQGSPEQVECNRLLLIACKYQHASNQMCYIHVFFFLDLQHSKGNSQERQRVKNRKILKVDCSTFDFRPKTTSLSDRDSAIERDRVFRPPRIRAQRIPNHK